MAANFNLRLSEEEYEALKQLAALELRDFRRQARLIIRKELLQRGLLDETAPGVDDRPAGAEVHDGQQS